MAEETASSSWQMPITGVTLYDNGYAVFEREAQVQGHGQIDLYFPQGLIKSVLDSLQFLGAAATNVGNIAYEATKPTASINFSQGEPMVGLLRTIVGSQATLCLKDGTTVEGRVLGIEENMPDPNSERDITHVSMYLVGGRLGTYPITNLESVSLNEEQIKQDISFSLDLTKDKSKENMQKLSVFYNNVETKKNLIARYGFQVSEWKSSYRMMISPDKPTTLLLHGLAIIENSLNEDWNDVKVRLVVGAPAIHSAREINDEGIWCLTIKCLDGSTLSVRANPKDSVLGLKAKIGKKKGLKPFGFKLVFCGKSVEEGRQLSDYTIKDGALLHMQAVESRANQSSAPNKQTKFVMAAQDNLSYYEIPMHVTAQRKQKAIVTMLQTELECQHVVLYDETIRKGNPLVSFLFENTTGRTLEGGSLILANKDTFLGDGTLPTLTPGDESPPIPYAVELGCEVIRKNDKTTLKPHRVEIVNGSIYLYAIHREITIYRIVNKTGKSLDFLLNHLFLEDYSLVQNPNVEEEEPVDITDQVYQFRFQVNSEDEKKVFMVREEITERKDHDIRNIDQDDFKRWVNRGYFDTTIVDAVNKAFNLRDKITTINKLIYEKEGEVREINRSQEHIRENIAALEHHAKQAAKYITFLEAEEERLNRTQTAIKKDKADKKDLEKQLTDTIAGLKFERNINKEN